MATLHPAPSSSPGARLSISERPVTGWALKVDGVVRRSSPSLISLGAYVDAIMAGADEADADNIARAIEARPWPTYVERMAVFSPAGPWKPSRDPFTPHTARKCSRADL